MRITLAQLNYHIGNFEANTQKILAAIEEAKNAGSDLVVFAELSICGYPPRDFLEFEDFIAKCEEAMHAIAQKCNGIAALVGGPSVNPQVEGKRLFNSAWFMNEGKVESLHHKALLPTYDIFDEYRYFEPAREFRIIRYKGKKLAVTVCEDIWDVKADLMYTVQPMDQFIKEYPDLMINISASPFSHKHATARLHTLQCNVHTYGIPIIYLNHTGAQTELIFDGGSVAMKADGSVHRQLAYFKEEVATISLDELCDLSVRGHAFRIPSKEKGVHDALVLGIRDYFRKLGFKKAILGLSGGIDSALTLALAAEALGSENVVAVLMPSHFSSDHSVSDSEEMVKRLGCESHVLPIHHIYDRFGHALEGFFKGLPFDVTEENMQARIRGTLLMAFSNKFGYILLNTSNKSEAAVGYGTLYGDMCGGLSVIGDVYKTEVYQLCRYINSLRNVIPENMLTKAPSAELRPDQKDSDSLPDYALLDDLLYQYIENQKSPDDLLEMGYDEALVKQTLRMVNINEYKRIQMPPVLRVSNKAFGMGRRMPIVARYLS